VKIQVCVLWQYADLDERKPKEDGIMKNYIYVPGLSEAVEKEIKKEELKTACDEKRKVSTTGAKKKYVQMNEQGEMKNHLIDDREIRIPLWKKYALTIKEASEYYSIAEIRLRRFMTANPEEDFVLKAGSRLLVKRVLFEAFLDANGEI